MSDLDAKFDGDFVPLAPASLDARDDNRALSMLAEEVRTALDRFGAKLEKIGERFIGAIEDLTARTAITERRVDNHESRIAALEAAATMHERHDQ